MGDDVKRDLYDDDHEAFRASFRAWLDKEVVPHEREWDADGIVPREVFADAGGHGFLAFDAPEAFGGGGTKDFRFNAVITEELQFAAVAGAGLGLTLHNDICLPYFLTYCTDAQKERWLPGICSGELITAIAMTEPGIGSDLASMTTTALRDGDNYVVNGSKTFITNGINADLVITAVKTDPALRHKGMSLLVLERGMAGFERGRNLEKIGQHAQDTAELFFTDVQVPVANRLGEEGQGFVHLVHNLPQERLSIAVSAQASAQKAFDMTVEYTRDRKAFGKPILDFQNSRFVLADLKAKLQVGWAHLDWALTRHFKKELTPEEGAAAKLWHTELQWEMMDKCLQLFGGAGYMNEYPIARMWRGARVTRIFGGTSEIMKELIGRKL